MTCGTTRGLTRRGTPTARGAAAAALLAALMAAGACAPPPPEPHVASGWQAYETALRRSGRLRTERAPADAPWGNAELVRAFREIMLHDEYVLVDGRFRPGRAARPLEKRTLPVSWTLADGSGTPEDAAHLREIARRIAEATGLAVVEGGRRADIQIHIAGAEGRRALAARYEAVAPGNPLSRELRNDLGDSVCIAIDFGAAASGDVAYGIFIPDEVTGRLRRACLEEEFAQAFGPAADWEGARPSVFNDDQEFALLTEFDSWLLRILYDSRLSPGMTEAEAMPIVRRIVAERRPRG